MNTSTGTSVGVSSRGGVFAVLFEEITAFECGVDRLIDRLNGVSTVRTEMNADLGGADRLGAAVAGVVFDNANPRSIISSVASIIPVVFFLPTVVLIGSRGLRRQSLAETIRVRRGSRSL